MTGPNPKANYASSCNACRQCTPLGACLAFKGIEGAVPFLHGSQGCATYIRRYLISHFREPIDIASSSFSEESAIFGGEKNFRIGIGNLTKQYQPKVIGVATTCLSETIGDDVPAFLHRIHKDVDAEAADQPKLVHVSTPSYTGSHIDGFHDAVRATVASLAAPCSPNDRVAVFPGMVSTSDLRYVKEVLTDFGIPYVLVPDYSDTMDGPAWQDYHRVSPGGTSLADLAELPGSRTAIDLTHVIQDKHLAGAWLEDEAETPRLRCPAPIGIKATDRWMDELAVLSGQDIPEKYEHQRGRLVDALVDGHKYVSRVPVAVYGEPDHAIGMAAFCSELGMDLKVVATGEKTAGFLKGLEDVLLEDADPLVLNGADFRDIEAAVDETAPAMLVGNSKGYTLTRKRDIPLVRTGFPIHDRFGGQRILHFGYEGAQRLLDDIINTVLTHRQNTSPVGWTYQ